MSRENWEEAAAFGGVLFPITRTTSTMLSELRAVLVRDLSAVAREVEAYPSDDALWRVLPGTANSGGVLARHLAGNLRHFIGALLGGNGYVRDRASEFAAQSRTRADVAEEVRSAAREVEATLHALPLAVLSEPFPVAVQERRVSTLQFLLHLSAHLAYHLGQIDYHRRSQDPAALAVGTMAIDGLNAIGAVVTSNAGDSSGATHVQLDAAFAAITDPWSPVVIGELNGQEVKAVRLRGEFHWHAHAQEDELFLVHRGQLRMEFRDRALTLGPGEYVIVPRGVEHRPSAEPEAEVILFEPMGIVRTGDTAVA